MQEETVFHIRYEKRYIAPEAQRSEINAEYFNALYFGEKLSQFSDDFVYHTPSEYSQSPFVYHLITDDIRLGILSTDLVKPYNYYLKIFVQAIPSKIIPILIFLAVCTVLYILFAHVLTGIASLEDFRTTGKEASVAFAITKYMTGFGWLAKLVTVAILGGFSSVILVMLLKIFQQYKPEILPELWRARRNRLCWQ